jgi:hypothetical protein
VGKSLTTFERLLTCRPINRQAGLTVHVPVEKVTPERPHEPDADKRIQQAIYDHAAAEYLAGLRSAANQSLYANDYLKFARRRIRRGEWSPGIEEVAPKKWTAGGRTSVYRRKWLKVAAKERKAIERSRQADTLTVR